MVRLRGPDGSFADVPALHGFQGPVSISEIMDDGDSFLARNCLVMNGDLLDKEEGTGFCIVSCSGLFVRLPMVKRRPT